MRIQRNLLLDSIILNFLTTVTNFSQIVDYWLPPLNFCMMMFIIPYFLLSLYLPPWFQLRIFKYETDVLSKSTLFINFHIPNESIIDFSISARTMSQWIHTCRKWVNILMYIFMANQSKTKAFNFVDFFLI